MRFKLSGREFELDRALVQARLAGQSPEAIRDHWVEVDGQRWPPKQVLEAAIGVQRSEFTSHTALRQLRRLGFETSTMPTDDGRRATMAATTSSPIASSPGDVTNDTSRAAAAFQTLLSFVTSEGLTERIAQLEANLQGADQPTAAAQAAASGLSDELLQASLLIRQHMGRISDVIHAAVITQALPLIIEEGERVTVRPSLAAGNDPGRPFDVETDRRVAEFKIQFWKGADAMRKRGTFKDLVHLALDASGRRAQHGPDPYRRPCPCCPRWACRRESEPMICYSVWLASIIPGACTHAACCARWGDVLVIAWTSVSWTVRW